MENNDNTLLEKINDQEELSSVSFVSEESQSGKSIKKSYNEYMNELYIKFQSKINSIFDKKIEENKKINNNLKKLKEVFKGMIEDMIPKNLESIISSIKEEIIKINKIIETINEKLRIQNYKSKINNINENNPSKSFLFLKNINNILTEITSIKNKIEKIYQIIDYKNEEFNQDYYFKEIKVKLMNTKDKTKLHLNNKLYNNQIFDSLYKFDLSNIKKLNLSHNIITSIKNLGKIKSINLEKLDLSNNRITDISFLQNTNFPKLKEFWLYNNEISDISSLDKTSYKNLEILSLSDNNIKDIKVLINCNFVNLKVLNLENNIIDDLSPLEKVKFYKLEKLGLNNNKIVDIHFLETNFFPLKELYLGENLIVNISVFEKSEFPYLKTLSLNKNKIIINIYIEFHKR